MKYMNSGKELWFHSIALLITMVLFVIPSSASLSFVGPTDPANGFPAYYEDSNGLALVPCIAGPNGFADPKCILPLANETFGGIVTYNPALPIVFPTNFPSEAFYWIADSRTLNAGPGGKARINFRMSLEGAFATLDPVGKPVNGQQVMFLRINLKKTSGLEKNSNYKVTYPFGTFNFTTDANGNTITGLAGQAFRTEDPGVPIPLAFSDLLPATTTKIGPFLQAVNPLPPAGYIGDPTLPLGQTITSGPNGSVLRIDGPNIGGSGINTLTTTQWSISGKIMTPGVSLVVDAPARSTPVNIFASYLITVNNTGNALDMFNLTIQDAPGTITSLTKSSVILGPNSNTTVLLNVTSSELGSYVVNVTATSSANASVNATVTTNTTVTGVTPSIAMLKPGESQLFTSSDPNVQWNESSGGAVGSIDATGNFTAIANGNTTITATNQSTGATVGSALVVVGSSRYTQPIGAGYNLIIIPVQPDPAFTASKILQLLTGQNPGSGVAGLKVVKWNVLTQSFETYDPAVGLNDFPITAGQAYFVKASNSAPNGISIVGTGII